jgi:hypothetical protein
MSSHYHGADHMDYDDVLNVVESELSLDIEKRGNDKVVITLMLGDKPIGQRITIKASPEWHRDGGHGGGAYIGGIRLDIV